MLQTLFHGWERRLASVTTDRVVRPFEWGLDWMAANNGHRDAAHAPLTSLTGRAPLEQLQEWVAHIMADTDAFFTPPPTRDYTLSDRRPEGDRLLTFPTAFTTPHADEQHGVLPVVRCPR